MNVTKIGKSLLLISLLPLLFACSDSKFSAVKNQPVPLKDSTNPRPTPPKNDDKTPKVNDDDEYDHNDPDEPVPPPTSDCEEYDYDAPPYNGPDEMSVWIVQDASKSNIDERVAQVAAIVDAYKMKLARRIPFTVAVIASHSPESPYSIMHGSSFYSHVGEPRVLRFDGSNDAKALANLKMKIKEMRTDADGISDGGELLTTNLLAALAPENISRAISQGAYKKGNILNVHFIGDENDICTSTVGLEGHVPSTTINGKDREEVSRQRHCVKRSGGNGGYYSFDMKVGSGLYSQTLLDRINELNSESNKQHAKIKLTGYIYTGENPVPREGQNEIGHGILELIEQFGGKLKDLAGMRGQQDYADASAILTAFINNDTNLYLRQKLIDKSGKEKSVSTVDKARTSVYIDGARVGYVVDEKNNDLKLYNCPPKGKRVKVKYCPKK